jgi:hypothetical protein
VALKLHFNGFLSSALFWLLLLTWVSNHGVTTAYFWLNHISKIIAGFHYRNDKIAADITLDNKKYTHYKRDSFALLKSSPKK